MQIAVVCPFLTAKKKLWSEALGYEFVHELEDLKMPEYVISVGFNLQLITDFYLCRCEVNDDLGLGSECSAQTPAPWGFVTACCWCEAPVFSEAYFHQQHRTVSVSTGTALCQCHCCGCMAEPTGRRCFSPH